jgi:glycosyltransferase involved in cell wall biosynthesis
MTNAKVQVILATYHRPKLFKRAVDSVLQQTFEDFELWIVKDGCSAATKIYPTFYDDTACRECPLCQETNDIGKNYKEKDTRVKYFVLPANYTGSGWGPRNFALLNSDISFVCYIDDDNWYLPKHIEVLYNKINITNTDFCYSGSNLFRDFGNSPAGTRCNTSIPTHCQIDTSEIMHKKEIIQKVGGWRNDQVHGDNDWDFVSRVLEANCTWSATGVITTNYVFK